MLFKQRVFIIYFFTTFLNVPRLFALAVFTVYIYCMYIYIYMLHLFLLIYQHSFFIDYLCCRLKLRSIWIFIRRNTWLSRVLRTFLVYVCICHSSKRKQCVCRISILLLLLLLMLVFLLLLSIINKLCRRGELLTSLNLLDQLQDSQIFNYR